MPLAQRGTHCAWMPNEELQRPTKRLACAIEQDPACSFELQLLIKVVVGGLVPSCVNPISSRSCNLVLRFLGDSAVQQEEEYFLYIVALQAGCVIVNRRCVVQACATRQGTSHASPSLLGRGAAHLLPRTPPTCTDIAYPEELASGA